MRESPLEALLIMMRSTAQHRLSPGARATMAALLSSMCSSRQPPASPASSSREEAEQRGQTDRQTRAGGTSTTASKAASLDAIYDRNAFHGTR